MIDKGAIWPNIKSHGRYPAFLLDIATKVPAGKSKAVFENWDRYVQGKRSVSEQDFKKQYFYDVLAGV